MSYGCLGALCGIGGTHSECKWQSREFKITMSSMRLGLEETHGGPPECIWCWQKRLRQSMMGVEKEKDMCSRCATGDFGCAGRKWVDIGALKDDKVADGAEEEENAEEA
ncbi:hypothetical protein B0H13DRAFT_1921938 [Mycena leptocephala]|nr:hypothetical protein B0H13DRAFT_1921938 [Mycena leptocephala]